MTQNNLPPVSRALTELGVPHRVFRHKTPIKSVEQAARERNQSPQQVVRSIVFRIGKGEYLMALIAGTGQISWQALRKYLGKSRLTMAKPEEVLAVTGYVRGTVGPFGLKTPLRILVDESVPAQDEISMGSGERNVAIIMRAADLMRALGDVEIVPLAAKE